jgi:transcriptional regulator with XRE-family HTH domain
MVNGRKIGKMLKEKGIDQKTMAARVGIGATMMSYIVTGFKQPSVEVLARIAKELECTVDELIKK